MAASPNSSATLPSLAIAASGLLWGLWWIPLRLVEAAGLQGAWASIVIFGLCALLTLPLALRGRRPNSAEVQNLLIMGVMSGVTLALWNFALLTGSVVRVTLLFYLAPVWGTLFGFLFFHLPLRGFRVLTIAFGFAGAVILLGLEGLGSAPLSLADGAALISSIAFALTATYSRKLGGSITGWQKTFVSGTMGALFAIPLLALPIAAGTPIARPMASSTTTSRMTSQSTPVGAAPSASRKPSSLRRRATTKAMTPYRPTDASSVASNPNAADNVAMSRSLSSVSSSCPSSVFISYTGIEASSCFTSLRIRPYIAADAACVRM